MSFEGELPPALSALKEVENGPSAPQVAPNYTKISESIRQMAPNDMLCSVFCGGRKCKYDSSERWDDEDMAIRGLYSHWITEDIVAMARPNTELINSENLVSCFHKLGIKTIINLQVPGEHAKCGPPLHESGFTYLPETFMANDIYYYNFGWRDYGVTSFEGLLDVIKVMAFALTEGKIAVHCHAGLGRTGVLISCYLMFSLRVRAQDAIRYVRLKRPGSVQTRSQIMLAQQFEQNMLPHFRVYCNKELVPEKEKKNHHEFTFDQYLIHQTFVLHGYEARALRYIPKIIFVICERILSICHAQEVLPPRSVSASSNVTYADHQHTGRDPRLIFTRHYLASRADQNQFKKSPFLQDWRPGSWEPLNGRNTTNGYVRVRSMENEVIMTDMAESECSGRVSPEDDHEVTAHDMQSWASGASGNTQRLEELLDQHFGPDISSNAVFHELNSQADTIGPDETSELTTEDILNALLADPQLSNLPPGLANSVRRYRHELTGRASAWTRLQNERRPRLLAALLWLWLTHLKVPVLGTRELSFIVVYGSHAEKCFNKLDSGKRYTLEYLLRFVSRLTLTHAQNLNTSAKSLPVRTELLKRLSSALTKQAVVANGVNYPIIHGYNKLGKGTLAKMLEFLEYMLEWIEGSTSMNMPLPKAISVSAPSTPVVPPTAPLPVAAESTSFVSHMNPVAQASTSYSISVPSSGSGSPALSVSPPSSGVQPRTPISNSARVGGNVRPSGRPSVPASAKPVKVLSSKEGRSISSPTLTMPIHEGVP